jgi:hypothetical protein
MAVATLEGVLNSLQTLGEEKLAALDETYAFELAWVRELFATCGTAAAVATSPEKLATPVDSPDEQEKAKLSRICRSFSKLIVRLGSARELLKPCEAACRRMRCLGKQSGEGDKQKKQRHRARDLAGWEGKERRRWKKQ